MELQELSGNSDPVNQPSPAGSGLKPGHSDVEMEDKQSEIEGT